MTKTRTFIAVEVSPAVRRRAADLIERLQAGDVQVKWVAPSNMHLTLKFLGDVAQADLPAVCRAVAEAVTSTAPFEVSLVGAGAFPDLRRPRVVWIGVNRGADALCSLQAAVDRSLKKIGFPKEPRRFHPHLTIGRIRQGGPAANQLGERIRKHGEFDAANATIRSAVVFASHLVKTGPTYEVLSRAGLTAGT